MQKLQPVIGVWNETDPTGTLPTVASQAAAMNSMVAGDDAAAGFGGDECVDVPDCDCGPVWRGAAGLRVYGADSVCEWCVAGDAGTREAGRSRLGDGIPDGQRGAGEWRGGDGGELDVDADCGDGSVDGDGGRDEWGRRWMWRCWTRRRAGATDIAGALTYNQGTKDLVALVSAPASLETGYVAATPFAVRVYASDGVTPATGANVSFVVVGSGGGAAVATGCGVGPGCVVTTDATGLAQTPLMGIARGERDGEWNGDEWWCVVRG